jgi:hypothetical protein
MKYRSIAAERILERRLIAAANEGADVPVALSARILGASRPSPIQVAASKRIVLREATDDDLREAANYERPDVPNALSTRILRAARPPRSGRGGLFNLRWPTLGAWQWSGFGAAAAAIAVVAVFGFQVWQTQLRSDQSFQIAMATIEDRSVLGEEPRYRTRGRQQQALAPDSSSTQKSTESHFRDMEVPTALLRRAINGASTDKGQLEYSELMSYLRGKDESFDRPARIIIDSALADIVPENVPEHVITQIRVYNLDHLGASAIRSKIRRLSADAHAIFLTLR